MDNELSSSSISLEWLSNNLPYKVYLNYKSKNSLQRMETDQLIINILLFVFLPLWGIAGFVDWCCHRATHIEENSGIFESILHSMMGIQIGIPMLLCLMFELDVGILLICFIVWVLHELVAHYDVRYASPQRHISIWEMHAHTYLGSLPLYMLSMIIAINWDVFKQLISFDFTGAFAFNRLSTPIGGEDFLTYYIIFMVITCVFPYTEELIRCVVARIAKAR